MIPTSWYQHCDTNIDHSSGTRRNYPISLTKKCLDLFSVLCYTSKGNYAYWPIHITIFNHLIIPILHYAHSHFIIYNIIFPSICQVLFCIVTPWYHWVGLFTWIDNTDRYCLMNLTTPFSSMISILYDNLYSITNIFQNTLWLVTNIYSTTGAKTIPLTFIKYKLNEINTLDHLRYYLKCKMVNFYPRWHKPIPYYPTTYIIPFHHILQ